MMVKIEGLQIDSELHRFLVDEVIPGSRVEEEQFWRGLSELIYESADNSFQRRRGSGSL
jgi:malate synthase